MIHGIRQVSSIRADYCITLIIDYITADYEFIL